MPAHCRPQVTAMAGLAHEFDFLEIRHVFEHVTAGPDEQTQHLRSEDEDDGDGQCESECEGEDECEDECEGQYEDEGECE